MNENTDNKTLNKGVVAQVIGPVVDVRFPAGQLPAIYNELNTKVGDKTLTVEVAQHIGGNTARCIAMESTDGLRRGEEVVDLGKPITVPVGKQTLGRIFNVLGDPVDEMPAPEGCAQWPIPQRHELHRLVSVGQR